MEKELTIDEQLTARLDYYGIADYLDKIEEDAKSGILEALSQDDVYRAFIDIDGALVIEYSGE
jgi:hypothetical protein